MIYYVTRFLVHRTVSSGGGGCGGGGGGSNERRLLCLCNFRRCWDGCCSSRCSCPRRRRRRRRCCCCRCCCRVLVVSGWWFGNSHRFLHFPRDGRWFQRGAGGRPQRDRIDIVLWIYRETCPHRRHVGHRDLSRGWDENYPPFVIRSRDLLRSRDHLFGLGYELKRLVKVNYKYDKIYIR